MLINISFVMYASKKKFVQMKIIFCDLQIISLHFFKTSIFNKFDIKFIVNSIYFLVSFTYCIIFTFTKKLDNLKTFYEFKNF